MCMPQNQGVNLLVAPPRPHKNGLLLLLTWRPRIHVFNGHSKNKTNDQFTATSCSYSRESTFRESERERGEMGGDFFIMVQHFLVRVNALRGTTPTGGECESKEERVKMF